LRRYQTERRVDHERRDIDHKCRQDFSKFLLGVLMKMAIFSGQRFRDQLLIRGLSKAERVIVSWMVQLDMDPRSWRKPLVASRLKQYEAKELHERLVLEVNRR